MTDIASFTLSPFDENTYIISAANGDCIIFDPGCYDPSEQNTLKEYITSRKLKPIRLINTHAHLDHIFGNKFIYDTYGILPEMHEGELTVLKYSAIAADRYGVSLEPSPIPEALIAEGDIIELGDASFETLYVPGHSPAHLAFYNKAEKYIIGGDVLFHMSIGRSDLPGGDHQTLLESIKTKFLTLPDDVVVYSGHGPKTSIGYERANNPFLQEL